MGKTWEPIDGAAGLFGLEKVAPSGWSWRSVALVLDSGRTLVVSPVRGTISESAESLRSLGEPAFALAPNHYHYLGLAELTERFPSATPVCTEVARPRLSTRSHLALGRTADLQSSLPSHVALLEPPGLATGEAWLRVETARGVAWVVSDAFFHVTRPLGGMMGLVLRATGTAPGLRIGRTFTTLAVRGRAYGEWLRAQLERDRPAMLVPGHGDVIAGDELAERLSALARARL
ncbi:MAG: hypothetical protein IT378_04370 [Sandaracinaceae bacterium]|nr:hypothetical protein [Sandaracinaceae bacterium]